MSVVTRTLATLAALTALAPAARAEVYYLIVGGLGGNPRYEEAFAAQARQLSTAARRTTGSDERVIALTGEAATSDAVRAAFGRLTTRLAANDRLVVFLVGHGSYDGTQYKFNLPGPDLDGAELAALFAAVPARTQLIVNATSASGAVLEEWAADGRVVVTATRSGAERNATRFAEHFAAALSADSADVDKDGAVTAQEAFDFAARGVADSYDSEGTLATEHPQLAGSNAGAFDVALLVARDLSTPELVSLNAERDALDERIAALRLRREELGDDYLPQLQALLLELARVQQKIDAAEEE